MGYQGYFMEKLSFPTLDEIKTAAERLRNVTVQTPLISYNEEEIYLKPETLQPVKSFKLRGMYNAVASLTPEQPTCSIQLVIL